MPPAAGRGGEGAVGTRGAPHAHRRWREHGRSMAASLKCSIAGARSCSRPPVLGSLVAPGGHVAASAGGLRRRRQPGRWRPEPAVVTPTAEAITIDGVLDEPIWRDGAEDRRPGPATAEPRHHPTEEPRSACCTTTGHLYIGVMAYDSEPQPGDRDADGARRRPELRRPHRDPARHLPRPAQRLLLRDEPGRRPGRRPDLRQRRAEHRLGRHLARAHPAHGARGGSRSSRFPSRA